MFPLPYVHPWDWVLYALAALDAILLVGGLLRGHLEADRTGRLPRPLRLALSAVLVVAALVGWRAGARGTEAEPFARYVLGGMALGFVGDLIMARVIRTPNRLVSGMAAFGVGHGLYIMGMLTLLARTGRAVLRTAVAAQGILLVFAAWMWWAVVRRPGGNRALNAGSLVYALVIGAMAGLAISLVRVDTRYQPLAWGAVLFLGSDLVLGSWQVKGTVWPSINDVIWCLYVAGQLLIVYSVAAAVRVLG